MPDAPGSEVAPPRVATYRWQLTPDEGFDAAAEAVPTIAALGCSHLYLSPTAEAVPGSTHGYDVADPTRLRDELGGPEAFARLVAACRATGLRLLLDIVPNHLAAHHTNPWWWDVLRLGRASPWAGVFDIDWDPPKRALAETVLLPVLGDHYGRELEAGLLQVHRGDGPGHRLVLRYFERELPLSPETTAELCDGGDEAVVDERLAALNADPDALDALLARQHHRLAKWTIGDAELDYRRFFDVDGLVGTRVDRPEAFSLLHSLPLELLRADPDVVDGLRVDHVDGLRDPGGYLEQLRTTAGPSAWLVVEKIVRADEDLPPWPIDGMTGYEVAELLSGWSTDPDGGAALTTAWRARTGQVATFEEAALVARREVLAAGLAADVQRVAGCLVRVCEGRRRHRDHARSALLEAVVEVAVHAPGYRSYVRPGAPDHLTCTDADRAFIVHAVTGARAARPDLDPELLDLLQDVLTGDLGGVDEAEVALRFQQLTGPVAAKGEEDTALYRWQPLPHRCDVGGDPSRASLGVDAWHDANLAAQASWPQRLTALSTHDSKRSLDARARLAALTTEPTLTVQAFDTWWAASAHVRDASIDPTAGWMVFHALVAAHPLPFDRAWATVEKSVREAGVRTSWTAVDEPWEEGLRSFVAGVVDDPACATVVAALVDAIGEAGDALALAQLAAQLLAPGVPDLYQGSERWDRSGVDPDNRRPVDPTERRALVAAAATADAETAWTDLEVRATGLPRTVVLRAALGLRGRHPAAFIGAYLPLLAEGPDRAAVLAFARGTDPLAAVVTTRPNARDATVVLPAGRWTDLLTDTTWEGAPPLPDLLATWPVALLERT